MQNLLSGFLLKDYLMANGKRDWCLSEWNGEAKQTFTKPQNFCLVVIPEIIFWHLQTCTAYAQCHYPPTWAERLSTIFMPEFV